MAANLSTSVQDTDADVPPEDLVMDLESFRSRLEEEGYSFQEEFDDLYIAGGDPQLRVLPRISLTPRNEDHYRAWFTGVCSNNVLTNLQLEDKQPIVKKGDMQEQALKKTEFRPYTISLNKILLSDGKDWSFLLDDIFQISHQVMSSLANLHDQSIVHLAIYAGNIYIADHMKAFLINSPKSKKLNKNAVLTEEAASDVKQLCKVVGGLCNFYKRNKAPDSLNSSNQEAEAALFSLIRRGYWDRTTAKDFVEELSQIIDVEVGEHAEVSKKKMRKEKKRGQGQASRLACRAIDNQAPEAGSGAFDDQQPVPGSGDIANNQVPKLQSGAVDDQGSEPQSGAVDNQGSEPQCGVIDDQGSEPQSGVMDDQGSEPQSGAVDDQGSEPQSGAVDDQGSEPQCGAVDDQGSEPQCGVIDDQGSEPQSGVMDDQDSEPQSGVMDDQDSEPQSGVMDEQGSEPQSGAVDEQGSEPQSGVMDNQGSEPQSGVMDDQGSEPQSGVMDDQGSDPQSGAMDDQGPENRESFSNEAITHEALMSDLEMEMFLSN